MSLFQLPAELSPQMSADDAMSRCGPAAEPYIEIINGLMGGGEYPVHLVIQDRLKAFKIRPSALVLTNRRVLVLNRTLFTRVFLDLAWAEVLDAHLMENWRGALFYVKSIDGHTLALNYLPPNTTRAAYAYAQRAEELASEWRRMRRMEEERARARGVPIQDVITSDFPPTFPPPPAVSPANEIEAGLRRLLDLKNKGLISEDEYAAKRNHLLSRL